MLNFYNVFKLIFQMTASAVEIDEYVGHHGRLSRDLRDKKLMCSANSYLHLVVLFSDDELEAKLISRSRYIVIIL